MSKKDKIIVVITVILLGIICGTLYFFNKESKASSLKFKEEYESLNSNKDNSVNITINKNNPIKYVTYEELVEKLKTGTNVIYFGFPNCPWCRNIINVLFDTAAKNGVDNIYYFNPKEIRSSDSEEYKNLITLLNEYLSTDEDGNKVLYVPDVYFVKDGKIVGNHLGSVTSQKSPYVVLTDTQKEELTNIYQDLFNKLK